MGIAKFFNFLTGNIDKRDDNGETALLRAARNGSTREVKRLLSRGADPDLANNRGLTALHYAAYWGEVEMTRALLRAGANANAGENRGCTPLHAAAVAGGLTSRQEVISLLMTAGAKSTLRDREKRTAADYIELWEKDAAAARKIKALFEPRLGTPRSPPSRAIKTPSQNSAPPARAPLFTWQPLTPHNILS